MKLDRGATIAVVLVLASGAVAQDSLLGKKKGEGSTSQGSQATQGSQTSGSKAKAQPQVPTYGPTASSDASLKRKSASRSGNVHYGGSINNRGAQGGRQVIQRAPTFEELRQPTIRERVRREETSVTINYDGRLRVGYNHWNSNWRDDWFYYPHYTFSPVSSSCVVSPWYYYSYVPGYISVSRIFYAQPWNMFVGDPYRWSRPSRYDRYDRSDRYDRYDDRYNDRYSSRQSELDYAIEDIVRAFEEGDRRSIDRLIPRNGGVTVSVDGRITYGLNVDDFYDMLMDATESARTSAYEIESVQTNRDEAEVVARHDYRDTWGQRSTVYHRYRLQEERGRMVIRYFATSTNPHW